MLPELTAEAVAAITAKLANWRQGDCVVQPLWFAYGLNPDQPISHESRVAAEDRAELAEKEVAGFVVVTQTCDLVRDCDKRPFVEVCPLVKVDDENYAAICKHRLPAYAAVPLLAEQRLVAHLDCVMTLEKSVVAEWSRTPGCETDTQIRNFSFALARKRVRFAFPDDFHDVVSGLQKRLTEKHSKGSPEGKALRALKEIRVQATPCWDADQVELFWWFIRDTTQPEPDLEGKSWADMLKDWLGKLTPDSKYTKIEGLVTTLADMTAEDYLNSDLLDLDHLSISTGSQLHAMVAEAAPTAAAKAAPTTD